MDTIKLNFSLDFEQTKLLVMREIQRKRQYNQENETLYNALTIVLNCVENSLEFSQLEHIVSVMYQETLVEFLQYVMTH